MVGFGRKKNDTHGVGRSDRVGGDGIAMGKGHKSALGISSLAAFLAFCGWGMAVIALAVLQHDCSSRTTGANVAGNAAQRASLALFQPTNSCGDIYGFSWWALALELFALLLCIASMWMPHFRKHRPGCVAILAISTVLAMFFANAFLGLKRLNTGGSYRRSAVAFAGFLTYAAFNMLLIIALGRYENDHPVNNTAVYPQQREVSGLDNNGPKMGANTGGPAINPVRGYAGPTPGNGTPVLHTDRNIV